MVANAEQLVIVSALADPPPRTGFIDRCLVAAFDAGIEPMLCLTKADLAPPRRGARVLPRAQPAVRAVSPGSDLTELRRRLAGRISVLFGHSGVGKSTLVNRLVPDADRAVGEVSASGRGRHTSSSAVALRLPPIDDSSDDPGWIVDTPGVRSFGLAHVSPNSLLHGFPNLIDGTDACPPGCDHSGAEMECGLDAWVAAGHANEGRLASYRRLLASRSGELADR